MTIKRLIIALLTLTELCACHNKENDPDNLPAGVFRVTLEQTDASEHDVLWKAGDLITVFDKTTQNKKCRLMGEEGTETAQFELVPAEYGTGTDLSSHYAVYPYDAATSLGSDEVLRMSFPQTQAYQMESVDPEARLMVARSNTQILALKHVGSYLCVKLWGVGVRVCSVTLRGNGGENLAGPIRVTSGADGIPSMAFDGNSSATFEKSIVLDASARPVALGADVTGAVSFWMAVPPRTFPKGFTITILDANGRLYEKSIETSVSLKRGERLSMDAFDVKDATISFGFYPASGTDYVYNKVHDRMSIYEAGDQAWFRFLLLSSNTIKELGPIPLSIAEGNRIQASYDDKEYTLNVDSYRGGILNLRSAEGDRFVIRF